MKDLKKAILDLLESAYWNQELIVDHNALYNLQEEYNIHFVEPEDKQVKLIYNPKGN